MIVTPTSALTERVAGRAAGVSRRAGRNSAADDEGLARRRCCARSGRVGTQSTMLKVFISQRRTMRCTTCCACRACDVQLAALAEHGGRFHALSSKGCCEEGACVMCAAVAATISRLSRRSCRASASHIRIEDLAHNPPNFHPCSHPCSHPRNNRCS